MLINIDDNSDVMAELRDAVPGAPESPCEVCEKTTIKRISVGDGFAAVCSAGCVRAWPATIFRELIEWADAWLPDEAKDQGARDVIRRCKTVLAQVKTSE